MTGKQTKEVTKLNIPGFAAEASLYNGNVRYQATTEVSFYGGVVQPAFNISDVINLDPRALSFCWEFRCFKEPHVGLICLWVNRCY
jgi:hypothetical protein